MLPKFGGRALPALLFLALLGLLSISAYQACASCPSKRMNEWWNELDDNSESCVQSITLLQLDMSLQSQSNGLMELSHHQAAADSRQGFTAISQGLGSFWCDGGLNVMLSPLANKLWMIGCMIAVLGSCWILASFARHPKVATYQRASTNLSADPGEHKRVLDIVEALKAIIVTYGVLFYRKGRMPENISHIFAAAHWGVQAFFILTGFTTFFAYRKKGQIGAGFILQKAINFLPAYYLALLVWMWSLKEGWLKLLLSVTLFVQDFVPIKCAEDWDVFPFMINAPCWIPVLAMNFWMLYPMICNVLPQSGFTATACTLATIATLRSVPTFLPVFAEDHHSVFNLNTFAPMRILDLLIGAICASLCIQMPTSALKWRGWGWVFDVVLLLSFFPGAYFECMRGNSGGFGQGDFLLSLPMSVVCVGAFAASQSECLSGLLCTLLSWWPLPLLGGYSLSVYCLTGPVNVWIDHHLSTVLPHLSVALLPVVMVWALSLVIGFVVEAPLLAALERYLHPGMVSE